jgi:four helix bundle protein
VGISNYRDLIVWQKAVDLVVEVYRSTKGYPPEERFGLALQMRRAIISIPSNIAEGQGRSTRKDYVHFLRIARGSVQELETQVIISLRLELISKETHDALLDLLGEVGRLLNGLIRSLSSPDS